MSEHTAKLEQLLLGQSKARAEFFLQFLLSQYPADQELVAEYCSEAEHQDGYGFYDQFIQDTEEATLKCLIEDYGLYAKSLR